MKLPEIENCWLGLGLLGFTCGSTQPARLHKLKVYATRCGENLPIETCKIAQTESLCYKMRREPANRNGVGATMGVMRGVNERGVFF